MYWQKTYERQDILMTLNNTYQLDLPKNGLLGSLLLHIYGAQATGLGQTGGKFKISDYISKIEIIADGSKVIKSLTGKQAQAIGFLDSGVTMPDMVRMYATNEQRAHFTLNFGRFLQDVDYGLDLSRWKNVEIRITNDATATYYSTLYVSIMSYYLRDGAVGQFKGYIASENWREWVPVASETKYLELPTDYLIRRIILNPYPGFDGTTNKWYDTLDNLMYGIELTFNTGSDWVWKDGFYRLMVCNYLERGVYNLVSAETYLTADYAADIGLGYYQGIVASDASKDDSAATLVATLEADTSSNIPKMENYEADTMVNMLAMGYGYQQCASFNFDGDSNPSTWLDTKQKDVVKLDITTRSTATVTSAKNRVVLERLVR